MEPHVERVAMAFYYAEADEHTWEHACEILKAEFRIYARDAIALLIAGLDRTDDAVVGQIPARCEAA